MLAISCLFCSYLWRWRWSVWVMPLKSDGKDSKGECNNSSHRFDKTDSPCSRCRKISSLLSLSNHVLQLERKHPLQIDVLSLKRPLKVADRGSKCGAIVAVIACCSTCGGSRRGSKRLGQSEWWPDSHHQPLCARIYGTAEVKTDKLDPREREKGSSDLIPGCFILNHHPRLGPYSSMSFYSWAQKCCLSSSKIKSPSVIE